MSSLVTCSAPWPVAGKPVNMRTPLAGAMRSKPSKDYTLPGRFDPPSWRTDPQGDAPPSVCYWSPYKRLQYICPSIVFHCNPITVGGLGTWRAVPEHQQVPSVFISLVSWALESLYFIRNCLPDSPQLLISVLHLQDHWQLASYGEAFHWDHRQV